MKFSYTKEEKLKSRKTIEALFTEGKSIGVFPLRLFYIESEKHQEVPLKTAVSVSKRNFKKATQRNHIKRLLRETYRLNKTLLLDVVGDQKYAMLFLYVGKEKPTFHQLSETMNTLMEKFIQKTKS
ncbi:ribonuclease P protein component [uncultured Planktosalinus sp.]|uniref:ribonuclease P protein component n=1 Tax=uncultured Planktosalinus sp. TaxID=1810935 RepID=UPI0030DB3AB0|tara:strand:+ start:697 stop:1074 length:378 start_codon:yes stop_codon:yes gene_type:complete